MNSLSNKILEEMNRLYHANISGVANPDELGKIIIDLGSLYSNLVRNGRVGENDTNETLNIISCFTDGNNYFNRNHNLIVPANTFTEGVYVAAERYRERVEASKPPYDSETYKRKAEGFKKL